VNNQSAIRSERNEAFRAFLDTLNPAQRRAVDAIEGPVLVIAGPGTGKTHILTARIGNILLHTDARAQNVLCLTFTDAGATAMRRRLLERIGPEAHRVPIFTFHAFCNRVIRENTEYFGRGNIEPVTELERIESIRHLLAQLPAEHPLRDGNKDIFRYEEHLRDLFATMKKEGWTPGFVLKKTDEFLAGLASNPDFRYKKSSRNFNRGDLKTAQIEEITNKMNRLKAAADLYPSYLRALERAGRYEYEDMLLWVLRAFEKNESLLLSYQERYQYILVDEFQDTNGAQYRLLKLLLDFWQTPNVFIVGDDDQSIYEFQGARIENLHDFYRKYHPELATIVLENNYRSPQAILDAAGRLIGNNALRAVRLSNEPLEKRLHSMMPDDTEKREDVAPLPVVLNVFPTRLHETVHIAAHIEQLLKTGARPSEIAVLYARHRQADRLQDLLGKKGIPFQSKRPANILDMPVVQRFRDLLLYLYEESLRPFSGEHRLFRLLHASWFGLDPLDLAKVALICYAGGASGSDRYERAGGRPAPALRWREIMRHPDRINDLELVQPQALRAVFQRMESWQVDLPNLPLPSLIERLYTQSGLLAWALNQPDKILYLRILHTFIDFVVSETLRNPRCSLGRLLGLLDSMDDNRLALPLQLSGQDVSPAASDAPAHDHGVQLLTAHAAKGLEFDHVFLFDCTDDVWEKNGGGSPGRFALPPTLTLSGEEDALEARRRLFYVAMTRAKRRLYISCARQGDDGKTLARTRFADETALAETDMTLPPGVLLEAQALLLAEAEKPRIRLPEEALIEGILDQFSLSISALNRYLRCPLAFYYEDLLKVPGVTSEAAAFGTAMHGTLQQFLLKMKSGKKMEWPTAEQLLRLFGAEMERLRGYFSEHGLTQRLALGKEYLRRIHVEQVPFWKKRAIAERRIDRVVFDGIPLTGVLDKIEWLDTGALRIVDYKTGVPDPKKTAPPDEKQPYGGEYWRQLGFYKILVEHARLYPEPVGRTAVSWLEPDKRGAFPVVEIGFTPDELHIVENLIREVYAQIRSGAFTTGCGKEDCEWCRMHRERVMPEPGNRDAETGLDDG
jgi:DNA helicase-2/ATP-dependent DNA helicase PcrA